MHSRLGSGSRDRRPGARGDLLDEGQLLGGPAMRLGEIHVQRGDEPAVANERNRRKSATVDRPPNRRVLRGVPLDVVAGLCTTAPLVGDHFRPEAVEREGAFERRDPIGIA